MSSFQPYFCSLSSQKKKNNKHKSPKVPEVRVIIYYCQERTEVFGWLVKKDELYILTVLSFVVVGLMPVVPKKLQIWKIGALRMPTPSTVLLTV
jgi:hypothetical protein